MKKKRRAIRSQSKFPEALRGQPSCTKKKKSLRTEFTMELETSHGKQPSKGIMCKERVKKRGEKKKVPVPEKV